MEELPIQYFLPNRLIHPADIVQTLNIPQDSQGNFCVSMKNEFESTFLETIMKVISSMFQKQVNYLLSLMLSRSISLQQVMISRVLMDSSIYLINKELNQKDTKTELLKLMGYDGLCYLYASEKLNPQEFQK